MINVILYAYYDVFVNNNSAISMVCFLFIEFLIYILI